MSTVLIEIRRAKSSDARAVADAHDEAWRCAYQGVIPGVELDKLIMRRGPEWWDSAIRKGSRISILAFGDNVAGYANYGRNRARSLRSDVPAASSCSSSTPTASIRPKTLCGSPRSWASTTS